MSDLLCTHKGKGCESPYDSCQCENCGKPFCPSHGREMCIGFNEDNCEEYWFCNPCADKVPAWDEETGANQE